MYLPDINVWVALAFTAHAHHGAARAWFGGLPDDGQCRFCRYTQSGFMRIANNPAAIPSVAVTQDQAWQLYDHFLLHPRVVFANEPEGIEPLWRALTKNRTHSPKAWNDAYLAAFAQAAGLEVVTFDKGFSQYSDVSTTILTGTSS